MNASAKLLLPFAHETLSARTRRLQPSQYFLRLQLRRSTTLFCRARYLLLLTRDYRCSNLRGPGQDPRRRRVSARDRLSRSVSKQYYREPVFGSGTAPVSHSRAHEILRRGRSKSLPSLPLALPHDAIYIPSRLRLSSRIGYRSRVVTTGRVVSNFAPTRGFSRDSERGKPLFSLNKKVTKVRAI